MEKRLSEYIATALRDSRTTRLELPQTHIVHDWQELQTLYKASKATSVRPAAILLVYCIVSHISHLCLSPIVFVSVF